MAVYQKQKVTFMYRDASLSWLILLRCSEGSSALVALYNWLTLTSGDGSAEEGPLQEQGAQQFIKNALNRTLDSFLGVLVTRKAHNKKSIMRTIENISAQFLVTPLLTGPLDFEIEDAYCICLSLGVRLVHGWVVDPDVCCYSSAKDFNRIRLLSYSESADGKDREIARGLLDALDHVTDCGVNCLFDEIEESSFALLYWRNRFDLLFKFYGALFVLVTDENLHQRMPQVVWMVFEKSQENIYLAGDFSPIAGQTYKRKAREWYHSFQAKLREANDNVSSGAAAVVGAQTVDESDEASREVARRKAANQKKKLRRKKKTIQDNGSSGQHIRKDDNGSPNEEKPGETKAAGTTICQDVNIYKSHESVDVAASLCQEADNMLAETHHKEKPEGLDASTNSPEKDKGVEAVQPQVPVSQDVDAASHLPQEVPGSHLVALAVESCQDGESQDVEAPTSLHQKADGDVSEGLNPDFLKFLDDFKDDGLSDPYFKSIVEAFKNSSLRRFYVPYEFIVAYDESLALHIQDNYPRIYEELKKSVLQYLRKNELVLDNVELKIIGLPEPKSTQRFLAFIESIVLHEFYHVSGESLEALPSYDSRRMGMGYLHYIIAKFRTGKCWGGMWSENDMKVKNSGSDFVIDCKVDFELTDELALKDLLKFCSTVLERLKHNGRFLLFFDEFSDDIMCISNCWKDPVKWPRFLELISAPLVLKPPLVRSAFLCNVYLGADANSSGFTPKYDPLCDRRNCKNWRKTAKEYPLLESVFYYRINYLLDRWSDTHWHVFKFSRHFIQHVFTNAKDNNLIQQVAEISVSDILLSRAIGEHIARSVRFLVISCGIDGVFSTVWRHYVGSEYVDKPQRNIGLADATATDSMARGLVDIISLVKKSGHTYSEFDVTSKSSRICFVSDADLTKFQSLLKDNGLKSWIDGDHLFCGSIVLWKQYFSPQDTNRRPVIALEGLYSNEYIHILDLLGAWLGVA